MEGKVREALLLGPSQRGRDRVGESGECVCGGDLLFMCAR